MRLVPALALTAAVALAPSARAETVNLTPRYDLATDVAVTGAAGAATLTLMLLEDELAPEQCRWCNPPGFDADLARSLRWSNPDLASNLSDGFVAALAGGTYGYAILQGYRRDDPETGWANALIISQATISAILLNTGIKYAVARQRPYAWRGAPGPQDPHFRNESFFSGHATIAFSLAASASTLLHSQGDPGAGPFTVVAFSAAAMVGYLRIAADRHFTTDVLTGAAVGTLIGWAIPHYFHPPKESHVRLAAAPGGIAIVW